MLPFRAIHRETMDVIPACIFVLNVLSLSVIHALYIGVILGLYPFLVYVRIRDELSTRV
jgi:hypothetical protein